MVANEALNVCRHAAHGCVWEGVHGASKWQSVAEWLARLAGWLAGSWWVDGRCTHHTALLKQVGAYARPTYVICLIEMDLNELAKAATVVVAQRLGIAKSLQDGISLGRRGRGVRVRGWGWGGGRQP